MSLLIEWCSVHFTGKIEMVVVFFVHGTYMCLTARWNGSESWSGGKDHIVTLYCSEIFDLLGYCMALIDSY